MQIAMHDGDEDIRIVAAAISDSDDDFLEPIEDTKKHQLPMRALHEPIGRVAIFLRAGAVRDPRPAPAAESELTRSERDRVFAKARQISR